MQYILFPCNAVKASSGYWKVFVDIGRRDLLRVVSTSGLIAAGLAGSSELLKPVLAQNKPNGAQIKRGEMLYRTLGRTGEQVSVIGLGGHHIGRPKDEQEGIRIVRSAMSAFITQ
jgi:hypothetical protein